MSNHELRRVQEDLAVMRRAMRLTLPFGNGIMAFDVLFAIAAAMAACFSLLSESDWLQQIPFAAIMMVVPIALLALSRRTNHEVNLQVGLTLVVYAVCWIAAAGYAMAFMIRPTLDVVRTSLLFGTSVSILLAFTLILVRAAFQRREQHYCLGLALTTLLAGMLLPLLGQSHGYSLVHLCMSLGCLAEFGIQRAQLREAAAQHAAD